MVAACSNGHGCCLATKTTNRINQATTTHMLLGAKKSTNNSSSGVPWKKEASLGPWQRWHLMPCRKNKKKSAWWCWRKVTHLLPGAKKNQPSHGSGGILATTSIRMPPTFRTLTATSFRKPTSTASRPYMFDCYFSTGNCCLAAKIKNIKSLVAVV